MNKPFQKNDNGKSRPDLIAPEFIDELGHALAYGSNKYQPRNWEIGADWSRYHAALLRHVNAWAAGEDRDPESGLHHMAQAGFAAMVLVAYSSRQHGNDDRTTRACLQDSAKLGCDELKIEAKPLGNAARTVITESLIHQWQDAVHAGKLVDRDE